MNACAILETLQREGIYVRREGDRLKLKPATGTVPADLIELARQHKTALLRALPDSAEIGRQRERLIGAARAVGVPDHIIAALDDLDVDGCQWLDERGLLRYAQIVQENHLRARGVAILRPTQPTTRLQPHPAVTCASCQHQQQQPDTSDAAGMHGCGKAHGPHFALEQHVCADWHPLKPQP